MENPTQDLKAIKPTRVFPIKNNGLRAQENTLKGPFLKHSKIREILGG